MSINLEENHAMGHECSSCGGCESRKDFQELQITGLSLVICAFLVFIAPLLAAAAGAWFVNYYFGSLGWSIVAAFASAGSAIGVARMITLFIQADPQPTENLPE